MENTNKPTFVNDHLANERTFLAWIRTALGIMGFGFVVVKFSLFMRQVANVLEPSNELPPHSYSSETGIGLVIIGGILALLSFFRFKKVEKQIDSGNFKNNSILIDIATVLVILVSIALTWYLITSVENYHFYFNRK